ncbi:MULTISPECIES: heme lyase NrfEFG subunit NrfF [Vibrio]|uniref:heme lyase NrfEFG subunit NrfF n=1 Tax=Vibrio TaxID=662 RepID=UPI00029B474E|nr:MULTISPECIES: heme lyase NrfEFG subunit NrfF [Vibrio]KNH13997.1 cytochrome C nitrite reductase [Vibrio lentus]MBY7662790.1 heme lyase NrfEFG subunit NrfF [Vibrio atlanticus]KAA8597084.1 Cytochrome c-type heme lyase subunit nrfF nitrite reductase complex assembly [Vibrio cyclitrophicus]NOI32687.1 heme lyase NrfEFG subunit NrfF [Vibrio cyclitrophicus]OBS98452.1 cytochrome C nitrite reductase [Vibrio cyclitrophicus]|tara:strand:+ start:1928 stop:2368 length:441 start_codon:yes stop_codon:yes gene_type:complete
MMKSLIQTLFMLSALVVISLPTMAEDLFTASNKDTSIQVELFEFENPEQQQRAISLAKTLRCPQCQNQNLIESNSPIAKDLRLIVFNMVKAGHSNNEITQYMTERFGEFVLYKPAMNTSNLLLWLMPSVLFFLFIYLSIKSVRKSS